MDETLAATMRLMRATEASRYVELFGPPIATDNGGYEVTMALTNGKCFTVTVTLTDTP